MRCLLLIAAFTALAAAKPGTYRETEDFQFSRSSSDEGHKAGYYGAQRGNTGGNYEKAHNMDSLAQNQMSSAVNHVQGEIGDTADAPTGSVFTSANTKGIYGRGGHYDLSNLQGRNFQENVNVDDGRSHSSLSSLNSDYGSQSSMYNSGHSGGYSSFNTKKSGYSGLQTSGQYYQAADQRAAAANDKAYTDLFDRQSGQGSAYNQQAGYGGYNRYDQSHSSQNSHLAAQSNYGSTSQTRLVGAGAPVRVVIRPGSTVNVPVAAEAYDTRHTASAFDQNSIASDAEVLTNDNNQQIAGYKPTNHGKSYESSYSYKKQWEKHDTVPAAVPLAIPTVNPYPINSELHEDYAANKYHGSTATSQNQLSHNYGYNTAASNSQYHSGYNAHQTKSAAHASNTNAYNAAFNNAHGSSADLKSLVSGTNADGTPKKYESSYSYHKSWERQGDPYIIQPATGPVYDGQASQRLGTGSATSHSAYRSNNHASHLGYSQSAVDADCDCDDQGHVRVARSYGSQVQQSQNLQDDGQVVQNPWNFEDLGQQTQQNQFENMEDLTQQTQQNQFDNLEDLGQQTQNKRNLEDLTQQTQDNRFDKYAVSGQHTTQNKLDKLEDLGQQTQGKQLDQLEDLGQQTQDLGQQTQQNQFESNEDFTQQTQQNQSDKLEDLGQQTQNFDSYYQTRHGSQRQGNSDKLNTASQHDQASMHSLNQGLQIPRRENIQKDSFQLQGNNENPIEIEQSVSQGTQFDQIEDVGQQTQNGWDKLEILNQNKPNNPQQDDLVKPVWEQSEDDTQQTSVWQNHREGLDQHSHMGTGHDWAVYESTHPHESQDFLIHQMGSSNIHTNHNSNSNSHSGSSLQSLWDKIDNLAQQSTTSVNSNENKNTNNNMNLFHQSYGSQSSNSQHSYQSWGQSNSETSLSSNHQNSFDSSYSPSNPWQFNHGYQNRDTSQETQNNFNSNNRGIHTWHWNQGNENIHTTEKPKQDTGNGSTYAGRHSWQWTPVTEETQPSEPKVIKQSIDGEDRGDIGVDDKNDDDEKPNYPGRGDIGADGNTATTEKIKTTIFYSPGYSNLNTKPFKTPEEIETLSLTKEMEDEKNEHGNKNTNLNANSQSDAGFSVIGINEQWLNEQKMHDSNSRSISSSTARNTINQNNNQQSQTIHDHRETVEISTQNLVSSNYSRKPYEQPAVPENGKKPKSNEQLDVMDKSQTGIEQQSTDQKLVDISNLEQQNTDNHFGFGQEDANLEQQSQTAWRGDLEDLGQQVQTSWNHNDNLEQRSDLTQQTGGFERFGQPQVMRDNFYEQKYLSANYQSAKNLEKTVEPPVESPVETSKKSDVEAVIPAVVEEVTTPKPGFWKSVGSKFVSAKDKVSSWFSSSS